MDMTGSYRVEAPRERVWEALNDPEILRQCISGCEEVQKVSDTEFTAKVTAKVGPVSAKFSGKVTLSDLDPPNGYTITGEGSGGAAGFGKGGASVRLEPDGTGTLLSYTANAKVGGKLAQIGSRLVDATARKMADEFFARFSAIVGESSGETASVGGVSTGAAPAGVAVVDAPAVSPPPQANPPQVAPRQAAPATVKPAVAKPQPEIPLPLPKLRVGGSGFYVPWVALIALALLFATLELAT